MTPWTVIPPLIGIALLFWWYHSACLRRLQRTWVYGRLMYYVVARWRLSICHTSMTSDKFIAGLTRLRLGDIVVTTDKWALSTRCVPGNHTHALLCIGYIDLSGVMMCAEMTRDGYGEVAFAKAAFHASRVVILRCPDWDIDYIQDVVEKCRAYKGAKYDTAFDPNPDDGDTYCSQLPWAADTERRLRVVPSRAWGTGQKVVTPDDLAASNVEVVYDSDKEQAR